MPLQKNKYSILFKTIVIIVVCLFLVNDIVWANPSRLSDSSQNATLAPELRLNPFFDKHLPNFQDRMALIYATGELRNLVRSGEVREGHIVRLNNELRERLQSEAVEIDGVVKAGSLTSGKQYTIAVFNFKEDGKKIEVLVFKDYTNSSDLTAKDREELKGFGIKTDIDIGHLDCPGLEGVWFINPATKALTGDLINEAPRSSSVTVAPVTITINGEAKTLELPAGATVLQAALKAGIYIPNLCHHPAIPPTGACRLCIVEIEGVRGLPTACNTPVKDGMAIKTDSPTLREHRRLLMWFLLRSLPEVAEGSRVDLVARYLGLRASPTESTQKGKQDSRGPIFTPNPDRCILCQKCFKVCPEDCLKVMNRGNKALVGKDSTKVLEDTACEACGQCVRVCPANAVMGIDGYPQGVQRTPAPCQNACPAGINIPLFLNMIERGNFVDALRVIRSRVPFPEVLAHVCPAPCKYECTRGQLSGEEGNVEDALDAKHLKGVAARMDPANKWRSDLKIAPPTGKKIAIIGSGPAGLTVAWFLRLAGHEVTILEAFPEPGGMMRYGIPDYRLPREVLRREIAEIKNIGVKIITDRPVRSVDELFTEGYDAVFLGTGATKGLKMEIPGEDSPGVSTGIDELIKINRGEDVGVKGQAVVVVGGGNTAMDVAKSLKIAGAKEVRILYRRTQQEMPADKEEVEAVLKEGIRIEFLVLPEGVVSTTDGLEIKCVRMELGAPAQDGRRRPIRVEGSEFIVRADRLISAISQEAEAPDDIKPLLKKGRIAVDPNTGVCSLEGNLTDKIVVSAGDAVTGPKTVIEAINAGRNAAQKIHELLGGAGSVGQDFVSEGAIYRKRDPGFLKIGRVPQNPDLPDEKAREAACAEASRCSGCDRVFILPKEYLPPPLDSLDSEGTGIRGPPELVSPAPRIQKTAPIIPPISETERARVMPIIETVMAENPLLREKDALIPLLQKMQDRVGYLPAEVIEAISKRLLIEPQQIKSVASFYAQFRFKRPAEFPIVVCNGTACYVKRSRRISDRLSAELKIGEGETTADGMFSLGTVACLGCCGGAPAMKIGDEYYLNVTEKGIDEILKEHKNRAIANEKNKFVASTTGMVYGHMENRPNKILICMGTSGLAANAQKVAEIFERELREHNLTGFEVVKVGDRGLFRDVLVDTIINGERITYWDIKPEDVARIVQEHLVGGKPVTKLQAGEDYEEFFAHQVRRVLKRCGEINPENIDDYFATDGYRGLAQALNMTPEQIIDEISRSGLRGRGGAGFPAGRKWATARKAAGEEKYIICNADEGDPGAFMDRSVLEGDPHSVIEGMIIAGFAVGAQKGYVYCRAEYPLALERMEIAIRQARERGILGQDIMGSGFSFDIEIKQGAGAFVCGEETAMIESIEGNRGEPRPKITFPAEKGLRGMPTVINNVETLANVGSIILNGADEYRSVGTEKSPGTKVFALSGKVKRTGLVEVPMGVTLRDIIFGIGGGPEDKRFGFKAVQIGGPSGGCLPESALDTPVTYEHLVMLGAIMGSGGMVVADESICMVDMAKSFLEFAVHESCGKCVPCRLGLQEMLNIMRNICEGKGTEEDLVRLEKMCCTVKDTAFCGLGNTAPNPVLTTLRYFRNEYMAHIGGTCPASICNDLVKFEITDKCKGCLKKKCVEACPAGAIEEGKVRGEKVKINHEICTKCGGCINNCPFHAIQDVGMAAPASEAEANRIHAENLDRTPATKDRVISCYIVANSILPVEQSNMLKTLEQEMRKEKYGEKVVSLLVKDSGNPEEFMRELEKVKALEEARYPGYEVQFYIACPSTDLVGKIQGLGMQALAFEKEGDGNIVQVEGIMLALRAIQTGSINNLINVYKFLTGRELTASTNDINELARTILFILPARKVGVNALGTLNRLIEENIKAAA